MPAEAKPKPSNKEAVPIPMKGAVAVGMGELEDPFNPPEGASTRPLSPQEIWAPGHMPLIHADESGRFKHTVREPRVGELWVPRVLLDGYNSNALGREGQTFNIEGSGFDRQPLPKLVVEVSRDAKRSSNYKPKKAEIDRTYVTIAHLPPTNLQTSNIVKPTVSTKSDWLKWVFHASAWPVQSKTGEWDLAWYDPDTIEFLPGEEPPWWNNIVDLLR